MEAIQVKNEQAWKEVAWCKEKLALGRLEGTRKGTPTEQKEQNVPMQTQGCIDIHGLGGCRGAGVQGCVSQRSNASVPLPLRW